MERTLRLLKTCYNISDFEQSEPIVLTIGSFDGVHSGHQKILKSIIELAKSREMKSALLTFSPHPRFVVEPKIDQVFGLITSDKEKAELLDKLGLDYLVIEEFNQNLANTPPEEYIDKLLVNGLKPEVIVVGFDHKFGKDRKGDIDLLREYEAKGFFEVVEIDKQLLQEEKISSTRVRNLLLKGDVEDASVLLTRPYVLTGEVVTGEQKGRELGYPTANIQPDNANKIIPAKGAYACQIIVKDQTYKGMLNIGVRPTVSEKSDISVEVHLFDFNSNLYGETLIVEFIKRIRGEKKFRSTEELKKQLNRDEKAVRLYLK